MKGTALIYHPGASEPEKHELEGEPGLEFQQATLKLLQEAVGGYIEAVPGFATIKYEGEIHACVAFCNEDGKGEQLPLNTIATRLWHATLPPPGLMRPDGAIADVLVGPVVVVYGDRAFMDDL